MVPLLGFYGAHLSTISLSYKRKISGTLLEIGSSLLIKDTVPASSAIHSVNLATNIQCPANLRIGGVFGAGNIVKQQ